MGQVSCTVPWTQQWTTRLVVVVERWVAAQQDVGDHTHAPHVHGRVVRPTSIAPGAFVGVCMCGRASLMSERPFDERDNLFYPPTGGK